MDEGASTLVHVGARASVVVARWLVGALTERLSFEVEASGSIAGKRLLTARLRRVPSQRGVCVALALGRAA